MIKITNLKKGGGIQGHIFIEHYDYNTPLCRGVKLKNDFLQILKKTIIKYNVFEHKQKSFITNIKSSIQL